MKVFAYLLAAALLFLAQLDVIFSDNSLIAVSLAIIPLVFAVLVVQASRSLR